MMFRVNRLGLVALACLAVLAKAPPAAADYIWTGNGVAFSPNFDGVNWSNSFNWQGNTLPSSGAATALTFSAAPTGISVNNLGTFTLNGLYFNTPIVLAGSQFSFASYQLFGTIYPRINQNSSGPVTIQNNLSLGDDFYVLGTGTGTVTLTGVISGNHVLNQQTTGMTVLTNGGNSYGGTWISNGTLRTDAAGALPAGKFVIVYSGTLDLNGTNQSIGSLYLSNSQSGSSAPIVQTGGGTLTLGGDVTFSPNGTSFGSSITGTLNLGGATRIFNVGASGSQYDMALDLVTGTGGLTKTGTGVLGLFNGHDAYTGGTVIQNGTLSIHAFGALPAGQNVTVQGGTLELNGYSHSIGSLTLSDPTTTNSSPAPVVNLGLATLTLGGNVTYSPSSLAPTANINGGVLNLGGQTRTFNIGYGGTVYDTVVSAVITGPGGLTKTGSGTLALTAATNYSGPTTVNAGFLDLGVPNSLPLSAVVVNGGFLSLNPGGIALGVTAGNYNQSFNSLAGSGGSVSLGAATLTVGADNTSTTFAGNLTAAGGTLVKVGTGTLALTGTSNASFLGGVTINNGVLAVGADNILGSAGIDPNPPLTVNPAGTLRYTTSTGASRTFTLNGGTLEAAAGATVTFTGATVNGGYLAGAGAFATAVGGTTRFAGNTTTTSTTLTLSGTDTLTNFTNGGQLTVTANRTPFLTRFTNTSSGRMTLNGTANVSDFVSNGLITIPSGGVLSNASSNSGIVLGGGSTTFIGSAAAPGGVINTGTQPLLVRGGYLVNNGAVGNFAGNAQVIVDYGGYAKGTGYWDIFPISQNGGRTSSGNSPGRSTSGTFIMNSGGNYDMQINDAGPSATIPSAPGVAGPTGTSNLRGWSLATVSSQLNPAVSTLDVTATAAAPFTINIVSLTPPTPPDTLGPMANFDPTQPYRWLAFDVNPQGQVVNWDPSAININTSQLANSFTGVFGIQRDGANPFQVYVTYSPVPESESVLLACAVGFGGAVWLRRRRRVALSA
jgi:fibronectin-binding autotransporter adhesin